MIPAMKEVDRPRGQGEPAFVGGSELLRRAYAVALRAHTDQTRRGSEAPYVVHPTAVAGRLSADGFDEEVVAAALLHDVVEDSETGMDEIVRDFGAGVGELVAALTEDTTIEGWAERKQALREQVRATGPRAAAIYAADKLSNVRDTLVLYAKLGEHAGERFEVPLDTRIDAWWADLEMVAGVMGNAAVVADLRAELEGLAGERRATGVVRPKEARVPR
jgi:hypothetical protein